MTHPGLAVMLMVGVGLGVALYYFFASTPEMGQQSMQQNYRLDNNNRTYWTSPSSDSRNRRPDQKCAICLEDAVKENGVRIISCMHVFHKLCIEKWRTTGTGEARLCCPNCRNKIIGLKEL